MDYNSSLFLGIPVAVIMLVSRMVVVMWGWCWGGGDVGVVWGWWCCWCGAGYCAGVWLVMGMVIVMVILGDASGGKGYGTPLRYCF